MKRTIRIILKKKNQIEPESWKKEWRGMPEFIQGSKASIKGVVVHFENLKDLKDFSTLVGRNVTMHTKGFFFPVKKIKLKTDVYR